MQEHRVRDPGTTRRRRRETSPSLLWLSVSRETDNTQLGHSLLAWGVDGRTDIDRQGVDANINWSGRISLTTTASSPDLEGHKGFLGRGPILRIGGVAGIVPSDKNGPVVQRLRNDGKVGI